MFSVAAVCVCLSLSVVLGRKFIFGMKVRLQNIWVKFVGQSQKSVYVYAPLVVRLLLKDIFLLLIQQYSLLCCNYFIWTRRYIPGTFKCLHVSV